MSRPGGTRQGVSRRQLTPELIGHAPQADSTNSNKPARDKDRAKASKSQQCSAITTGVVLVLCSVLLMEALPGSALTPPTMSQLHDLGSTILNSFQQGHQDVQQAMKGFTAGDAPSARPSGGPGALPEGASMLDTSLARALFAPLRPAPEEAPKPVASFIITTASAVANGRLQHALDQIASVGIPTPRVVYGLNISDEAVGCRDNAKWSCRLGLITAQAQAWRAIAEENIPSAWIFEDDVLFHDNFKELMEDYWAQVPAWYEAVYVQHWPVEDHMSICKELGIGKCHGDYVPGPYVEEHEGVRFDVDAWGAGAYILSSAGARRLDASFRSLLWSKGLGSNTDGALVPLEVTPDDFLRAHGLKKRMADEAWVLFDNTLEQPAVYRGVTFSPRQAVSWYWEGQYNNRGDTATHCHCNDEPTEECKHFLPVVFYGLAYQHFHCSNMTRFHAWVDHYKMWQQKDAETAQQKKKEEEEQQKAEVEERTAEEKTEPQEE